MKNYRTLLIVVPRLVSYLGFLRELCGTLIADGAEVHVACSPAPLGDEEIASAEDGVQLHHIEFPRGMNPAAHLRAARALNRLVKMLRPEIVHAHFSAAIFTSALARTSRWPVTHATFHGVSFLATRGWKATLLRPMETWAACRLDTVWVLSDDDRDGLQAAAPPATVRRLPGFGVGCDLAKFAPSAQPSAPRLARNSESRASMLLSRFSVASLISKGSPASPARSWRFLRRTRARGCCSSARAIGSTLPGSARRKSARSKPRRKSSTSVFAPDVERCLPAADVLLFSSRREGMPVFAMEALALGVPVITCDARGCREVVRDGVDGLVLRDGRLATLRAAMQAVLDDEGSADAGPRRHLPAAAASSRSKYAFTRIFFDPPESGH